MAIRLGKRWLAAAALLVGAAAVISLFALGGGGNEDAEAEQASVPTMPLERRNLAERVSVDGALGYADEAEVIDRLSGTVTWLPEEGAVIRRGQRLFEIDDEPVALMYGDLPAYRDLVEGTSGGDVKALEANLAELGLDAGGEMTVDDDYTSATASAVSEWQDSLGLTQTGAVELGRVVFQPGPRRVSSLDVSLGSDASSAGSGSTGVDAAASIDGESAVLVAARAPEDEKPEAPADEKPGQSKPGGEKDPEPSIGDGSGEEDAEVQPQPTQSSGESSASAEGSGAAEAAAVSLQVLTTTSIRRQVSVELDPDQVSAAKRGASAVVTLPDGDEVKGRIATVATVAESSTDTGDDQDTGESGTESATIEVTISLEGRAGASGLDQAPVDVELTEDVRREVFAVPVEALIGTSGGEYAIVVADDSGGRRITVEPGLFADGYVEIEGEGLESGLAVEVPEG